MSNGLISFRQIRRVAEVVKQASAFPTSDGQLSKALCKRLLPSIDSQDVHIRVQVELAVLDFQRLSGLQLGIDATLDALAYECAEDHTGTLKKTILAEYDEKQVISLIDWLINRIGCQASDALVEQRPRNKRDRKPTVQHHDMTFESAAVLLNCICHICQEMQTPLPSSYFNVIALEAYVKDNKDDEGLMISCCGFNLLLSLSTKLDLLSSDFERRQRRQELEQIYARSNLQGVTNGESSQRRKLEVNREQILMDSMELLDDTERSLSNGIQVTFSGEEGQDAGGLLKEWMLLLCMELIPLIFCQSEKEAAKSEIRGESSLSDAHLMGIVIGLSIRHRIPLDISVPDYVYRQLFSSSPTDTLTLTDLGQVRPILAKGLAEMLLWDEEGFSERLSLNFSYHSSPESKAVPLLPDGDKISVTYQNRHLYVQRLCSYVLQEQCQDQLEALSHGLDQVCQDLASLQLFSTDEIDGLVCGQEIAFDVSSLRRISSVDPPSRSDSYIDDFWAVLEQANDQDLLRRFLHFVTASHRIPLTSSLQEASIIFRIVILHGQEFAERLPTASTCTNTLFLPRYPTKEQLRIRLFTALDQGSVGFGLK